MWIAGVECPFNGLATLTLRRILSPFNSCSALFDCRELLSAGFSSFPTVCFVPSTQMSYILRRPAGQLWPVTTADQMAVAEKVKRTYKSSCPTISTPGHVPLSRTIHHFGRIKNSKRIEFPTAHWRSEKRETGEQRTESQEGRRKSASASKFSLKLKLAEAKPIFLFMLLTSTTDFSGVFALMKCRTEFFLWLLVQPPSHISSFDSQRRRRRLTSPDERFLKKKTRGKNSKKSTAQPEENYKKKLTQLKLKKRL
nr:uncharacterized protein LOC108071450 isoform X1 [Drosophila kikkawai]